MDGFVLLTVGTAIREHWTRGTWRVWNGYGISRTDGTNAVAVAIFVRLIIFQRMCAL